LPGEHCGFCPAKGRCPELRKAAVEKAKMVFDCPKEPREYSDTEIAEILAEVDMIEAHIEGVRQYARRELEKGRKIPGWKLVEKRAAYRWTDWERVSKELIEILGFGYNEITKSKPMTPLQIKKVLKDHKMPQTIIDEYFVKESSGTTLAKEDDKRPHVTPNPFGD
jgi:tRNA G10  N-methylase Trm11